MAIQKEAILQKHARLWCREALAVSYEFFAFDRSKKTSQWSHMYEKMRGIQRSTPDTLLVVAGSVGIWCEFKSPGNKPNDGQKAMGERLQMLGNYWFWATSVEEYMRHMSLLGIPMHANAAFLAMHHDGSVATEIAKAEAKAGVVPKVRRVRKVKASSADVARFERARAKTY